MIYKEILRSLFFRLDAEVAHERAMRSLKLGRKIPFVKNILSGVFSYSHPALEIEVLGRKFKNPVGLAAGFDKDCEIYDIAPSFGFGFVECGTVTPREQGGNSRPRLFRLQEEEAIINRMGFNNRGSDFAERCLKNARLEIPLGINIGKNKITPPDKAVEDYLYAFEKLSPYADYTAINVSSPNTPGLRDMQKDLSPLLSALKIKNDEIALGEKQPPKPVFVKIAPDLSSQDLDNILECCVSFGVTGIIATNTTVSREGLNTPTEEEGGLSGKPLFNKSTDVLKYLYKNAGNKMVFIGVGGISSAEDAYIKIKSGASLVQLYTGWIYGGPSLVSGINKGLVNLLQKDGFKNIKEAVGSGI